MTTAERNFANFYLEDNVYELANGLIPELGSHFEVELGTEPNSEALSMLVGAIGKNKVLRENAEVQAIDLTTAADLVNRSGVQRGLSRSLWQPRAPLPLHRTIIATGGVANWQDRTTRLITQKVKTGEFAGQVLLPVGNRVMDGPTDVLNRHVITYKESFGTLPREYEYAHLFVAPLLKAAGVSVELLPMDDTDNGDEIAARTIVNRPELFSRGAATSYARVANAGIQLAVQFREVGRLIESSFDGPGHPQVFVETDSFPIARTPEQVQDAAHFQSPFTALRQVALTAKLLHETAR